MPLHISNEASIKLNSLIIYLYTYNILVAIWTYEYIVCIFAGKEDIIHSFKYKMELLINLEESD